MEAVLITKLQSTSLSLYFLQKNFIIFSIHEKRSKISDCIFAGVCLEADNVVSFKQN